MDVTALLVCADQDSTTLLTHILSELGMTVEHSPSISRGLELLESRRFDAIVLDYRADARSEEFLSRLRLSAKNRATMLVAVVDEGFNTRPVFGLGANFVLYRPLTSERTRMSLRAARGLMRHERRRAPRTPVVSTVNVAYPGAPDLNAVLADLSDGGTLIHTAKTLPSACKVYFEFALPGQPQLVRLSGEVAWQDASGRTGIRFLDVPQASRRLMQGWLQQTRRPASASPAAKSKPAPLPADPLPADPFPSGPDAATSSHTSEIKLELKNSKLVSNAGNRRTEHRLACKLGAEVYRAGTTIPNRCTLSDISENGCYVEMPSPLPGQSAVEILVRTADTKLRICGQVLTTHPGFGMGVRFNFRDSAEREEILRLLAILSPGPSLDQRLR